VGSGSPALRTLSSRLEEIVARRSQPVAHVALLGVASDHGHKRIVYSMDPVAARYGDARHRCRWQRRRGRQGRRQPRFWLR